MNDAGGVFLVILLIAAIIAFGIIVLVDNVRNTSMCRAFGYTDWDTIDTSGHEIEYVRCYNINEAPTLEELMKE